MTRVVAGAARGRRLAVPAGARDPADLRPGPRGPVLDPGVDARVAGRPSRARPLRRVRCRRPGGAQPRRRPRPARRGRRRGVAHRAGQRGRPRPCRCRGPCRPGASGWPAAPRAGRRTTSLFLDPPYDLADADLRDVLAALWRHGWLAPGAVVVVERATRGGAWRWPEGFVPDRSRRYGEATLWYGRAARQPGSRRPVPSRAQEDDRAPLRVSGLLRPGHQRPPRRHRAGEPALRRGHRRRCW